MTRTFSTLVKTRVAAYVNRAGITARDMLQNGVHG